MNTPVTDSRTYETDSRTYGTEVPPPGSSPRPEGQRPGSHWKRTALVLIGSGAVGAALGGAIGATVTLFIAPPLWPIVATIGAVAGAILGLTLVTYAIMRSRQAPPAPPVPNPLRLPQEVPVSTQVPSFNSLSSPGQQNGPLATVEQVPEQPPSSPISSLLDPDLIFSSANNNNRFPSGNLSHDDLLDVPLDFWRSVVTGGKTDEVDSKTTEDALFEADFLETLKEQVKQEQARPSFLSRFKSTPLPDPITTAESLTDLPPDAPPAPVEEIVPESSCPALVEAELSDPSLVNEALKALQEKVREQKKNSKSYPAVQTNVRKEIAEFLAQILSQKPDASLDTLLQQAVDSANAIMDEPIKQRHISCSRENLLSLVYPEPSDSIRQLQERLKVPTTPVDGPTEKPAAPSLVQESQSAQEAFSLENLKKFVSTHGQNRHKILGEVPKRIAQIVIAERKSVEETVKACINELNRTLPPNPQVACDKEQVMPHIVQELIRLGPSPQIRPLMQQLTLTPSDEESLTRTLIAQCNQPETEGNERLLQWALCLESKPLEEELLQRLQQPAVDLLFFERATAQLSLTKEDPLNQALQALCKWSDGPADQRFDRFEEALELLKMAMSKVTNPSALEQSFMQRIQQRLIEPLITNKMYATAKYAARELGEEFVYKPITEALFASSTTKTLEERRERLAWTLASKNSILTEALLSSLEKSPVNDPFFDEATRALPETRDLPLRKSMTTISKFLTQPTLNGLIEALEQTTRALRDQDLTLRETFLYHLRDLCTEIVLAGPKIKEDVLETQQVYINELIAKINSSLNTAISLDYTAGDPDKAKELDEKEKREAEQASLALIAGFVEEDRLARGLINPEDD